MGRADFFTKRGLKLKRWQVGVAVACGVFAAYMTVFGLDIYWPF